MKILPCPRTPPCLWMLVRHNTFSFSLTLSPISSQYSIYVETKWLVGTLNNFRNFSSLPIFLAIKPVKMENIDFTNRYHVGHLIKGSCLGTSYTYSAPCLVWYRYIFCRLRYVFHLSGDLTKPLRWDAMHIYGWKLLAACHHTKELGDHKHSDSKRKNPSSETWVLLICTATEELSWLNNH